jgi:hypothetical protein
MAVFTCPVDFILQRFHCNMIDFIMAIFFQIKIKYQQGHVVTDVPVVSVTDKSEYMQHFNCHLYF